MKSPRASVSQDKSPEDRFQKTQDTNFVQVNADQILAMVDKEMLDQPVV